MTIDQPSPSEGQHLHQNDLRIFKGVEAWIFDLDNTLYPHDSDLFPQINDKITEFVARHLDLGREAARAHQKELYHEYGTTLRGLMNKHRIDPDAYLEFVHDIDYSNLAPDPALGRAIEALPGKKFIFTNGDRPHAERTAAALGFPEHFEDIFDIVAADLIPKPDRRTYEIFLERTGVAPARAAMFEDLQRNLTVPHRLGMVTALVIPEGTRNVFDEDWDPQGGQSDVDFVTDNLAGFLTALKGAIS